MRDISTAPAASSLHRTSFDSVSTGTTLVTPPNLPPPPVNPTPSEHAATRDEYFAYYSTTFALGYFV